MFVAILHKVAPLRVRRLAGGQSKQSGPAIVGVARRGAVDYLPSATNPSILSRALITREHQTADLALLVRAQPQISWPRQLPLYLATNHKMSTAASPAHHADPFGVNTMIDSSLNIH